MLEVVFAHHRILIAAFALAVVATLAVHPTWARSIGADVWNVPALEAQMRATTNEGDHLEAEDSEIRNRIAVKEAIVADLIAGRIALPDAVEQFTALDAERPQYTNVLRAQYPDVPDHELMPRHVVAYTLPRTSPHERSAVAARLEVELHQMLAVSAGH